MNDGTKDKLGAIALGALGGGVTAFLVWQFMKVQVDHQVTVSVDTAVAGQLQQLGITPSVAANIRTVVNNLDSLGILSTLATATSPGAR